MRLTVIVCIVFILTGCFSSAPIRTPIQEAIPIVRVEPSGVPIVINFPERVPIDWVSFGRTENEVAMLRLIKQRVEVIENGTVLQFGHKWAPKLCFVEWIHPFEPHSSVVRYDTETNTFLVSNALIQELETSCQQPLHMIDIDILANDPLVTVPIDRELGRAYLDDLSERSGYGSWYTKEKYDRLTRDGQLGIEVVTGGLGDYFRDVSAAPADFITLTDQQFPYDADDEMSTPVEAIVFYGGHWLVWCLIEAYGTEGVQWLIAHPPEITYGNMRMSIRAYELDAEKELKRLYD